MSFYIFSREDLALLPVGIAAGCATDAPGSFIAWPMPGVRYDIGSLESYERVKERFMQEGGAL